MDKDGGVDGAGVIVVSCTIGNSSRCGVLVAENVNGLRIVGVVVGCVVATGVSTRERGVTVSEDGNEDDGRVRMGCRIGWIVFRGGYRYVRICG